MQERKRRTICLGMVIFILLFGICFDCVKVDSFMHRTLTGESTETVFDRTRRTEFTSENATIENLEENWNLAISQQPDDQEEEYDEPSYWLEDMPDSESAAEKQFYSESRRLILNQGHQQECVTNCIQESDGKKREKPFPQIQKNDRMFL